MRLILIGLLAVLITGCAQYIAMRDENRSNINKLSLGMTTQNVISIMGEKSSSGTSGTVNNPYKKETGAGKDDQEFEIYYYYTDRVGSKDWNAGMTPTIFQNGKLAGVGWNDFNRLGLSVGAKPITSKPNIASDNIIDGTSTSDSRTTNQDKPKLKDKYPAVKVTKDSFKKLTKYQGAELNYGELRSMFLRLSKIDGVMDHSYQFYFVDNYDGGWRFYDSAHDSNGNKLDAISIDRSVGSCSKYSGCSHWEHVGVSVSHEYLQKNSNTDFKIKISGRGGEIIFNVPADYVRHFLNATK